MWGYPFRGRGLGATITMLLSSEKVHWYIGVSLGV